MANAVITLSTPQEYDLRSLAETTRQSLQLLKPWTLVKDNAHAGEIATQAAKYVSAIQMGVSAAYSGFTVTEEVLFLAHALPIEDKEDLQRYLVGMMELAKEARENANKAHIAFRNVRTEIYQTAEKLAAEEETKNSRTESKISHEKEGLPQYSKEDLEVLMKFADHISKFASWWDWVKVETDPSQPADLPISFHLDALKDPEVVKRWEHIRSQYTSYVQMIGEMEDSDPHFFSRSWAAGSQVEPDTSTATGTRLDSPSGQSNATGRPQQDSVSLTESPPARETQEAGFVLAQGEQHSDTRQLQTRKEEKGPGLRRNFIKRIRRDYGDPFAAKVEWLKQKAGAGASSLVSGLTRAGFVKGKNECKKGKGKKRLGIDDKADSKTAGVSTELNMANTTNEEEKTQSQIQMVGQTTDDKTALKMAEEKNAVAKKEENTAEVRGESNTKTKKRSTLLALFGGKHYESGHGPVREAAKALSAGSSPSLFIITESHGESKQISESPTDSNSAPGALI